MATVDLTEKSLGEFRILRRLGGGGMADVYLAEQSSLGRHVALKVMRQDLMSGSDDVMVKRFKQEAMTAAGLNHANIVQVYTIGEDHGFYYIAQELVQGKNLAQLLKSKGQADVGSALHIMRQVASALKAAGQAGIIHRDIKPENLMLTKKGEVKITDFGLAQLTERKKEGNLTEDGMTLGTPLYMSPEQVKGEELDTRTDIYSFGITCYHMLCGEPPFRGNTPMAIAIQHVNNTAEPILDRNPKVPGPMAEMIHRMMARERDRRYLNADQVSEDIRKLVSAQKARQDLNLVKLPVLSELKEADPKSKSGDKAEAKSKSRSKGIKGKGSKSSKMRMPALQKSKSKPKQKAVPKPRSEPAPKRRADDEEEEDFFGRETPEVEEMDLTPMVDVTFLLLIFFMITASFTLQKSLEVPAPDPDDGASMQPATDEMISESIEVYINDEDVIEVADTTVDNFDDLVSLLEQKMGEEGKTSLLLEAAPKSTHGMAVMVFDAAQAAKMQKIRQKLPQE